MKLNGSKTKQTYKQKKLKKTEKKKERNKNMQVLIKSKVKFFSAVGVHFLTSFWI